MRFKTSVGNSQKLFRLVKPDKLTEKGLDNEE